MGAEQAKVGWGGWGVGNAAVTGDWVGGKVGKENTDKLTGKTQPLPPRERFRTKASCAHEGPSWPSAAETHGPGSGMG